MSKTGRAAGVRCHAQTHRPENATYVRRPTRHTETHTHTHTLGKYFTNTESSVSQPLTHYISIYNPFDFHNVTYFQETKDIYEKNIEEDKCFNVFESPLFSKAAVI